jgi:hypothetical protein
MASAKPQQRDQIHTPDSNDQPPNAELIYTVLYCVFLEGGLIEPRGIPVLAEAMDGRSVDYQSSIETCLSRKWIKTLSSEDCDADEMRWANEPDAEFLPYRVGALDFTTDGWNVFVQLTEQRRGVSFEAFLGDGASCLWGIPGQGSLLSFTEVGIIKERNAILAGKDNLDGGSLTEDHTLGEIVGPYAIGPWWVNRFYVAPIGHRLDVAFTPADKHPEY